MARNMFCPRSIGVVTVAVLAVSLVALHAGQPPGAAVPMDTDDIAGVVTGPNGPEAGVWVIAETRDLPTRHIKIVVTDDQGRYLVPDLPHATYDVWVRGYGLEDSERVQTEPGAALNLTAMVAPSGRVSDGTSATAARHRAQRGRQLVGLGRPPRVHARPDLR